MFMKRKEDTSTKRVTNITIEVPPLPLRPNAVIFPIKTLKTLGAIFVKPKLSDFGSRHA